MSDPELPEEFFDPLNEHGTLKEIKEFDFPLTFPKGLVRRVPTEWSDELFMERVRKISLPDLTGLTTMKVLTQKVLHFFLTGTKPCESSISTLFQRFIVSLQWRKGYYYEPSCSYLQPIYEALIEAGATVDGAQSLGDPPSLETLQQDFAQRLATESFVRIKGKRKRHRGRVRAEIPKNEAMYNLILGGQGLATCSRDVIEQHVEKYYQYVEYYFDEEARRQAQQTRGVQPKEFLNSEVFVRSLYLLALICFRSRAKHPESVKKYILSGGYRRLMEKLFGSYDCRAASYSISPETESLMGLLHEFYDPKVTSVETAVCLIYFYCNIKGQLGKRHIVEREGEVPKNDTRILPFDDNIRMDLGQMLEGGCMLRLRYKGLALVAAFDELLRLIQPIRLDSFLPHISTTLTVGPLIILLATMSGNEKRWVERPDGKYEYIPNEFTWLYSRNVDETAYINLATAANTQLIWRLLSIIAKKRANVNVKEIRCTKAYIPTGMDEKYVKEAHHRLFEGPIRFLGLIPFSL